MKWALVLVVSGCGGLVAPDEHAARDEGAEGGEGGVAGAAGAAGDGAAGAAGDGAAGAAGDGPVCESFARKLAPREVVDLAVSASSGEHCETACASPIVGTLTVPDGWCARFEASRESVVGFWPGTEGECGNVGPHCYWLGPGEITLLRLAPGDVSINVRVLTGANCSPERFPCP